MHNKCPLFPLTSIAKLLLRYKKNVLVACKMYKMVYADDFASWKREWLCNDSWKMWLDKHRLNSQHPSAIAYRKQCPKEYQMDYDLFSNAHDKYRKAKLKAIQLKATPSKMPRCLAFAMAWEHDHHMQSLLPNDLAYTLGLCSHIDHSSILESFNNTSSGQMAIMFDLMGKEYDVLKDPIALACAIFIFWAVDSAYAYAKENSSNLIGFDTYGIVEGGYDKFKKALAISHALDSTICSKDMKSALEVLIEWYKRKHAISGVFAVLASDKNGHCIDTDTSKSYKRDVVKKELLLDLQQIIHFKK